MEQGSVTIKLLYHRGVDGSNKNLQMGSVDDGADPFPVAAQATGGSKNDVTMTAAETMDAINAKDALPGDDREDDGEEYSKMGLKIEAEKMQTRRQFVQLLENSLIA